MKMIQLLKFGRNIVSKMYSEIPLWILDRRFSKLVVYAYVPIQNALYEAMNPEFHGRIEVIKY